MRRIIEERKRFPYFDLHLIPTKKFKTTIITIKFLSPLSREKATKKALLPFLLQKGTKQYPTERSLRIQLDELYDAQLSIDSAKKGENFITTFRMEAVNENYLQEKGNMLEKAFDLLQEILLSPKAENGSFDEKTIQMEKRTLEQKIKSIVDQKMSYANMRLIDEMCKDEPYQVHVHGYLEDLESLNGKTVFEQYQEMIERDRMDIYVLGDIDPVQTEKLAEKYFHFRRANDYKPSEAQMVKKDSVNEIIEEQDVQQGKLHMGFRTFTTYKDSDYFALQVFNGLFGGFPHSKLFLNVREKHQLAYYASSRFESHKGLLLVFSGIAPEQYGNAKTIILKQMDDMKEGKFTDQEVEETKKLVLNQLKETLDHPYGIVEMLYHQVLAQIERSPDELLNHIRKVTKNDVEQIAEKIQLDTVYFLTNENKGEQS
ncbi:MAG: insulinase family protein [Bacillaceae bacterium]|nr:insulinase family protein [Bacillaceae bacterium]